ncbi:MAG: hypothetical protein KAR01_02240 [Desulfocapsa sp.]|nr:hypothetical protein [Desulfocapsa sp.]
MKITRYSLYTITGSIVITAIIVAMAINGVISYHTTKTRILDHTKNHSTKTINTLNKNISNYIESYSVNEYETLVLSEMDYVDFYAIIVHDYSMGKVLGRDVYISGKIRDVDENVIDYDPENKEMNKSLNDCYLTFTTSIISASGLEVGDIRICTSGHTIEQEQREIIKGTLITSALISITLILFLFFTIHRIVLKPISKIVDTLSRTDKNGIPIGEISTYGSLEIKKLSTSISNMIAIIRKSRYELEEKHGLLLHAEKLSSVGRFAASIAHEFNNPLCGVVNVIRGINTRATLSDNDQKLAAMALCECDRMKNLISDLQQFSKPSPGEKVLTNINNSIDEVLLFTKKELKDKKVSLIKRSFSSDLPEIWVIPDQIKQVLINLIGNAGDAIGDEGGTVSIAAALAGGNSIIITIKDSGEGIIPENIKHIFEPFYTTKAIKGTGLGLSVSYGIIKSHGGQLTVESELGKGSTFTIILPTGARQRDEK